MTRRLYEIAVYKQYTFSRVLAVERYNQVKNSRKPFALAIRSLIPARFNKDRNCLPNIAYNLIDNLKKYRQEYNQTHNIASQICIKRIYHGQTIEIEIVGNNKLHAIRQLKQRIRTIRLDEKRIDNEYGLDSRITRRRPNGLLAEFQSKRLRISKSPKDTANYIGIEIECIVEAGIDLTPLFPFSNYVDVGGDGSIQHHNNEEGMEVRVCTKREEVREVLPKIMQTLKGMGARINKSCGLHVHLDQRNNNEPQSAFQRLVRSLGLLYTVVPESRRRNRYCKRNRSADFITASRGSNRYVAVNATAFHRYHTIEVRLFGGTLEAPKIINWIEVLLAITDGETVMRCPKTFDTALKYWKLSEENLRWLKERQIKFSSLNTGMPVSEHETEPNQRLLDETQSDEEEDVCDDCGDPREDCPCGREEATNSVISDNEGTL